MTAAEASRSSVGSWATSTSPANVTMPTFRSSGAAARNALAASWASPNLLSRRMLALTSMARIVVRSTALASPAGSASAGSGAPSSDTDTESRSGSLVPAPGSEKSTWNEPSPGSTWSMLPSAA